MRAWRRGDLSVRDKQRVIAAVVDRITINRGVRGRSFVGNRPEGPRRHHLAIHRVHSRSYAA